MSLVNVPINVEDISVTACDFDYIDVYRAETKWGSYTKITDSNSRLELCEEESHYEYGDEDGSEYHWYKWKYVQTDGTESIFYGPIQAHTPNVTYCKFDDVKRLLRSRNYEGSIRFSDIYKNLRKGDDAQDVSLAAISLSQDYSGTEPFKLTFLNVTDFKLEVGDESELTLRYLGQGNINTDFIANDYSVRINSDDWSGTPVQDDEMLFDSDSHMSINDAIQFIRDAEILVDVILEENLGYTEAKDNELRFTRSTAPKAIGAATARFAAFFIYTTIYKEQQIAGLPSNINDITTALIHRNDDLSSWAKQAMKYLSGYIKKYSEYFDPESGNALQTAPRWITDDSLFDGKGVVGVGKGLRRPDIDLFFSRSNQSYDGLLDWDLLFPGYDAVYGTRLVGSEDDTGYY
ncbi:MAG: hypothetical protein ACTSW7_01190 [Candidatus Thorarchaeota archaeon]|nr:hypothetical protein [Thermoplasmatales archaeon]